MIKISKELQKIIEEFENSDCWSASNIDDFIEANADYCPDLNEEDDAFERGYELGCKNSSLYKVKYAYGEAYFAGDLENKILPMFRDELHILKQEEEREKLEEEKKQEKRLTDELKEAEERVKELRRKVKKTPK